MEHFPQMTMNLNLTELNKLDDEANTETGLLAHAKQDTHEYISSNSVKTQDAVMAESAGGAEATAPAHDPPELEVLGPGISEKESSSQILSACNGEAKVISSKGVLHKVCSANKWKLPEYEYSLEQDPSQMIRFTCKVIVEIPVEEAASTTFLECFSNPMPKKKAATEHATSGAIWYLKQLGYFPSKGKSKSKRRKNNHKKPKTDGEYNPTSQ